MEAIAINKDELKDIVIKAVSEAIHLDIKEIEANRLNKKTLNICNQTEQDFKENKLSSFDEVYKKCMK